MKTKPDKIPAGDNRWLETQAVGDGLYNARAVGTGWPVKVVKRGYAFAACSVPLEVLLRRAAVWAVR